MVLGICFVQKGKLLENPYKLSANFKVLFPSKNDDNQIVSLNQNESKQDSNSEISNDSFEDSDSIESSDNDLNDLVEVYKKGDPYLDPSLVDDDSVEENRIMPDDSVMISTTSGNGINSISVYIYNKKSTDFYLHHEIITENEATCIDWMDYDPAQEDSSQPSNIAAVGTFENHIELWDLDIINTVEPILNIGNQSDGSDNHFHRDSISCIKWNKHSRNIIATGSMDKTVMLWDLSEEGKRVRKYKPKKGIIRNIAWHPEQTEPLLVLSSENFVTLYDCRYKTNSIGINLGTPSESILWSIYDPFYFFVGCENGDLMCFDIRTQSPVYTVNAHQDSISEICSLTGLNNNIVTCGDDNVIKLWDIKTVTPVCVYGKKLKGSVTALASCIDEVGVFSYGSFNEDIKILDFSILPEVKTHFKLT